MRERIHAGFAWGVNDCALFAFDAVEAITGVRHHPHMRAHRTALQGMRQVRSAGGLGAIATAALGEPVAPRMAAVGDMVLVRMGKREALGVCNGVTVAGPGPAGLMQVALSQGLAAWRVG